MWGAERSPASLFAGTMARVIARRSEWGCSRVVATGMAEMGARGAHAFPSFSGRDSSCLDSLDLLELFSNLQKLPDVKEDFGLV